MKREGKKEEIGKIFETISTGNFLKLISDSNLQIQEAQRTTSRINAETKQNKQKTPTTRHIIFNLQKIKDQGKNLERNKRGVEILTHTGKR